MNKWINEYHSNIVQIYINGYILLILNKFISMNGLLIY